MSANWDVYGFMVHINKHEWPSSKGPSRDLLQVTADACGTGIFDCLSRDSGLRGRMRGNQGRASEARTTLGVSDIDWGWIGTRRIRGEASRLARKTPINIFYGSICPDTEQEGELESRSLADFAPGFRGGGWDSKASVAKREISAALQGNPAERWNADEANTKRDTHCVFPHGWSAEESLPTLE